MCGIVGCAGAINAIEEKLFKQLLIFDTVRGEDSTGIASVDPDGDVLVAKAVGTPYDLFSRKLSERIFQRANRVLIGHNRYATQGAVNNRNAHPFEFDNVVGVHNGTLKNRFNLKYNHYVVDSEQLYANIDSEGVHNTIPKVEGAYALVWYDTKEKTLKILRNDERPLFYVLSEDGKKLFWASEEWMLVVALNRGSYKHRPIIEIEKDQLYTFNVGVGKKIAEVEPITIVKEELKQAPKSYPTTYGYGYGGWSDSSEKSTSTLADSNIGKWIEGRFNPVVVHQADGGSKYIQGFDSVLKIHFRMYSSDHNYLATLTNKVIEGKILGVLKSANIYILAPQSVRTKEEAMKEALSAELDEELDVDLSAKAVSVVDHAGKPISLAAFQQRYSVCSNCSSDISYGDLYKPLDHNSCLCADCVSSGFSYKGL